MIIFLLLGWSSLNAQVEHPVRWAYTANAVEGEESVFDLVFTADIDPGWYLYSQHLDDDGPIPTAIRFYENDALELIGETTEEGDKVEGHDPIFDMPIVKFNKQVQFTQRARIKEGLKEAAGYIEFMTCDEEKCLPPTEVEFAFSFRK